MQCRGSTSRHIPSIKQVRRGRKLLRWCAAAEPGLHTEFPANREFFMEFHDFEPSRTGSTARKPCAAGVSYLSPATCFRDLNLLSILRLGELGRQTTKCVVNARLSDADAEHEQLSVDPRRSPQRIGNTHLADKLPYLGRNGLVSTTTAPRFPAQYDLNPARCHFMTVSGFPIARALMTVGAKRYSPAKIKRSMTLKVCLFGNSVAVRFNLIRRIRILGYQRS